MEHRIILHFTESNQVGDAVVRCRQQFLGDVIEFLPVAFLRPVTRSLWQILRIVLTYVIRIVKKVLTIEFYYRQRLTK